jgi:sugar lactone lactonase YvrE
MVGAFDIAAVDTVAGFRASEGVAVDRQGRVYGGGSDGVVRRRAADGHVEEFARCSHSQLAGMAFDGDDNLFVCDLHNGALVKVDPQGTVSRFADRAGDAPLCTPNFPVFDAEGNLWVSNSFDRPLDDVDWDVEFGDDPHPWGHLARFRPDGTGEVIVDGLYLANGTAIDPGERYVYVLQSTKQNCVRVPLAGGEPEVFCPELGGMPDGMAFDAAGNLIVTLPWERRLIVLDHDANISTLVVDPTGDKLAYPTNCAFGDDDLEGLYIASPKGDLLGHLRVGRTGHPLLNRR